MRRRLLILSLLVFLLSAGLSSETYLLESSASASSAGDAYEVSLYTIPRRVYKENDGVDKPGPTETWVFNVLVREKSNLPLEPRSAIIEFYAGHDLIKTVQLSAAALNSVRGITFKGATPEEFSAKRFAAQEESFDLRHKFSEPVTLHIDRLVYSLKLTTPRGKLIQKTLTIPVSDYAQKTKLIFPLKGAFTVLNGHVADQGHQEWSQHFAYDIAGLGPHLELVKTDGETSADFYGWGREVLAPAGGAVVYSRNDVPDNDRPGVFDVNLLNKLPAPMWAIGGNCVVIDHGSGEFSFLAHMQQGSVRVQIGDRVKQGQVIGLLGSSGRSQAPHLHYHLMAGGILFRSDGLPSHFENLEVAVPKRGTYLEAK